MEQDSLKQQVQEHFPEGLTGIISFGGTRTTFILEHNRDAQDPGKIDNLRAYGEDAFDRGMSIVKMFLDVGGQNLIINMFWYQGFYERGDEYAQFATKMCLGAIDDNRLAFYKAHQIDPYFVGIDTLLHLPEDRVEYSLGRDFMEFQQTWEYNPNHRKLIWEVAPIPLFSILNAHAIMGEEAQTRLNQEIARSTDLQEIHDILFKYYSKAIYGTDVPMPHFYLGSNRNGDMKMRAMLPIALLCGGPFRMFYTPYPSFYLTYEAFRHMIDDLINGKRLRSQKRDYSQQMTPELIQAEYNRIMALSQDKFSTIGLTRGIES